MIWDIKNQKSKTVQCKTLKPFTNHEKMLSNCLMIILKLKPFMNHKKMLSNCLMNILKFYLKLNTKQNMEKDSKYWLLNKYVKD